MINSENQVNPEGRPDNREIINRIINNRYSKQSQKTRNSCLNYFFGIKDENGEWIKIKNKDGKIIDKRYFGYEGHIFDITKGYLKQYLMYLQEKKDINPRTKKTKYTILKSFLDEVEDLYGDSFKFLYRYPKKVRWDKSKEKKKVYLTSNEIKSLLDYIKYNNYKYYLIFRLMGESGLRKGGVIDLDYDRVNLEKRYIETREKNGPNNVYYLSKKMVKYLRVYLEERKLINADTNALFLSVQKKRYSLRPFNQFLENIGDKIGFKNKITCQVLRRSLNNLREEMGCPEEKRCILLNHSVSGVNYNHYVEKKYVKFLGYFDEWNPYKNLNF